MSVTRDNHFVPQWYQRRFFEDGQNTLAYLDMKPPVFQLKDGTKKTRPGLFSSPTSRAFVHRDLYSTFFGTSVNDEIECKLFGDIDTIGADAVRAFAGADEREWHEHFQSLFQYLDMQKLRTPKGLAWLRTQYPELSQNELMIEMQGIQMINGTIWTEGVREIVSAEDSEIKFIISDHPVTIYNHAISPADARNQFPHDPPIALKASQTIFPLGPDHCLILTNLEYAKNPSTDPVQKRTFARNFRSSMVSTINFVRSRKLTGEQVAEVNFVIKSRAQRNIAAGRKEWLYPELTVTKPWKDIRTTLLPPEDELFHFGGEMYAGFKDGHVHYQDAFGRSEQQRPFLVKEKPSHAGKPHDPCRCGSGMSYGACCRPLAPTLRPSWDEKGIRERNIMLYNAICNILEVDGKDWLTIRREFTDEKIVKIYHCYEGLWPLETDLLSLLPKPDGRPRAIYTGAIHPQLTDEFAFSAPVHFGQIIMQHPFVNAGILAKEYRPTENPRSYRGEVLKAVMFFLKVFPYVASGLINLIPDPCDFNPHLRRQMMAMARLRSVGMTFDKKDDPRFEELMHEDFKRSLLLIPKEGLKSQLAKVHPELGSAELEGMVPLFDQMRDEDELATLQEGSMEHGGLLNMFQMSPNFEIAMYLAQATGAHIVTDSVFRLRELKAALGRRYINTETALTELSVRMAATPLPFPTKATDMAAMYDEAASIEMRSVMNTAFNYLRKTKPGERKHAFETQLAGRFDRAALALKNLVSARRIKVSEGTLSAVFRVGGIQDNSVNRLLLMSSSEHHLPFVPMAFHIQQS